MTKVRSEGQRMKYAIRRAAKEWSAWREVPVTDELRQKHAILEHCSKIYANSRCEVRLFNLGSAIGGIVHVIVARHGLVDYVTVNELQRVKNELFGIDKLAVEIYPTGVTDLGKTRHLWVLPAGYDLPYGLEKPNAFGEPL